MRDAVRTGDRDGRLLCLRQYTKGGQQEKHLCAPWQRTKYVKSAGRKCRHKVSPRKRCQEKRASWLLPREWCFDE
jgi:hypothetical protein